MVKKQGKDKIVDKELIDSILRIAYRMQPQRSHDGLTRQLERMLRVEGDCSSTDLPSTDETCLEVPKGTSSQATIDLNH